jgi:hypothetical protein
MCWKQHPTRKSRTPRGGFQQPRRRRTAGGWFGRRVACSPWTPWSRGSWRIWVETAGSPSWGGWSQPASRPRRPPRLLRRRRLRRRTRGACAS